MGFTEKTDYLIETKGLLKDRINSLGGSITSGTTFRDYLVWLDSLYEALEEKTITGLPDSLEGKCEQTGTPTPTSPQPINITTGRQVVSVCEKNLFNKNTTNIINANLSNSKINSSANERVFFMKCKPNTSYTFSISLPSSYKRNTIATTSSYPTLNMSIDNAVYSATAPKTYTTGANAEYIVWLFYSTSNPDYTEEQTKASMQIEEGTTATTYEEYKGNDYEINLGKNLFNIDGTRTSEGITNTTSGTIISVNGTATNTYTSLTFNFTQNIPIGTYTFSIQDRLSTRIGFIPTFSDNTTATYHITANQLSTTFTTTKEIKSYRLYMETINGTTYNLTIKPQLEKGSQASSFSLYKTPIYLGKIGTYQDYIFRNTTENPLYDSNLEEGQWYIHKEIGRVVLNGSEDWTISNSGTQNWYYSNINSNIDIITDSTTKNSMSNYYQINAVGNSNTNQGMYIVKLSKQIRIRYGTQDTVANFKTWLSSHNTEVYYVLNTPTNTLIEDEELINQLNEIEIFTVISEDFYN